MSNKGYPSLRRKMTSTMTDVSSSSIGGSGYRENVDTTKRANKVMIYKKVVMTLCGIGILIFAYMVVFAKEAREHVSVGDEKKANIRNESLQYDGLSNRKLCISAVDRLLGLNVILIALDFDLTIIDIHSHGTWDNDNIHELVEHVRPEILCLITESFKRGLHISVTSFSKQEILINNVMKQLLTQKVIPHLQQYQQVDGHNTSSKLDISTIRIPVFGGENYEEEDGKRKQLQRAMDDINKLNSSAHEHQNRQHEQNGHAQLVTPSSIILIDDNSHNIKMAREDGYYSVLLDPESYGEVGVDNDDNKLFQSIIELL